MVNTKLIKLWLKHIMEKYKTQEGKAFEVFSISLVLKKELDEVHESVLIDTKKDGGIDGGLLEQEDENSYSLYMFQCKKKKRLKQNDLKLFKQSVDDFLKGDINKPNREGLKRLYKEYKALSSNKKRIKKKLYFIFEGDTKSDKGNKEIFDSENSPDDDFNIVDIVELDRLLEESIGKTHHLKEVRFNFKAIKSNLPGKGFQSLVSYEVGKVKAANFRMSATDLCELYDLEEKTNKSSDFLFSENVRGFLGYRKINKKIRNTLESTKWSNYFSFLNNGITIICSKMEVPSNPQVGDHIISVTDPLIVNGFQTTRIIHDFYKDSHGGRLKKVYLNVKLFETTDDSLIYQITQATNTQNPINFKDKLSKKKFQEYAKNNFHTKSIAYLTKRGNIFSDEELKRKCRYSIRSDRILKFWYASFYEKPDIAKRSIADVLGTIFDATNGDHELKVLFDGSYESPLYHQLLIVYKILDHVGKKKKDYPSKFDFIHHSDELLVYGIYKEIMESSKYFSDKNISGAYENAVNVVNKIVKEEKKLRKKNKVEYSNNTYFKGNNCKSDYNRKKQYVEPVDLANKLLKLDIKG